MSQAKADAAAFFRRKSSQPKPGFNLLPNSNSFSSVFKLHELDEGEAKAIEELLEAGGSHLDQSELSLDIQKLKNITAEVKSISKQGVILLGERISKARAILTKYGDGKNTFTAWLIKAFGSRRSAYNTLSYYELYTALPSEVLREKLKNLPLKAAYALASRQGEMEEKVQIISDYAGEKPRQVIEEIQKRLPLKKGDRRKTDEAACLKAFEKECRTLLKKPLSSEGKDELRKLLVSLVDTIDKSS